MIKYFLARIMAFVVLFSFVGLPPVDIRAYVVDKVLEMDDFATATASLSGSFYSNCEGGTRTSVFHGDNATRLMLKEGVDKADKADVVYDVSGYTQSTSIVIRAYLDTKVEPRFKEGSYKISFYFTSEENLVSANNTVAYDFPEKDLVTPNVTVLGVDSWYGYDFTIDSMPEGTKFLVISIPSLVGYSDYWGVQLGFVKFWSEGIMSLEVTNSEDSIYQPGNITLTARVDEAVITDVSVEFFDGGKKIGDAVKNPSGTWQLMWNSTEGVHSITAVVNYNKGFKTVSRPVLITVSPSYMRGDTLRNAYENGFNPLPTSTANSFTYPAAVTSDSKTYTYVEGGHEVETDIHYAKISSFVRPSSTPSGWKSDPSVQLFGIGDYEDTYEVTIKTKLVDGNSISRNVLVFGTKGGNIRPLSFVPSPTNGGANRIMYKTQQDNGKDSTAVDFDADNPTYYEYGVWYEVKMRLQSNILKEIYVNGIKINKEPITLEVSGTLGNIASIRYAHFNMDGAATTYLGGISVYMTAEIASHDIPIGVKAFSDNETEITDFSRVPLDLEKFVVTADKKRVTAEDAPVGIKCRKDDGTDDNVAGLLGDWQEDGAGLYKYEVDFLSATLEPNTTYKLMSADDTFFYFTTAAETIKAKELCRTDIQTSLSASGDTVKGYIKVENNTGSLQKAVAILALYNGDRLVDVSIVPYEVESQDIGAKLRAQIVLPEGITEVNRSDYSLNIYCWDGLKVMAPY